MESVSAEISQQHKGSRREGLRFPCKAHISSLPESCVAAADVDVAQFVSRYDARIVERTRL
jgi:hypothetical protein